MKRALICGVTGQDGGYLSKFLLDKGYGVFGSTRSDPTLPPMNLKSLGIAGKVTILELDLLNVMDVRRSLEKIKPDEVYNLTGPSSVGASFTNPQESIQAISVGTMNLLEAIKQVLPKTKLFLAGSSECFGNIDYPATESTPFSPRSPYAISKVAAHWMANIYREGYGLYVCTGFLFNHESILRTERYVSQKVIVAACRIAAGSQEKLSLGNISIARDWGWAPEYVQGMWQMLQADQPQDYLIATGQTHTLEQFVGKAFAALDLDYRDFLKSDPSLLRPTDILKSAADPTKARVQLGWQASYDLDEIIKQMISARQVV